MQKIKRFYEAATVGRGSDGYAILLDGRAVRTPGKATLEVGSAVLAEAIAEEWQAQDEEVDPTSMPMNNLACTAIDIVTPRQQEIVEDLAGYGGHDLICYWTDESGDLLSRQQQHWQPLLDWAAQSLSAPLLKTCGGGVARPAAGQPGRPEDRGGAARHDGADGPGGSCSDLRFPGDRACRVSGEAGRRTGL